MICWARRISKTEVGCVVLIAAFDAAALVTEDQKTLALLEDPRTFAADHLDITRLFGCRYQIIRLADFFDGQVGKGRLYRRRRIEFIAVTPTETLNNEVRTDIKPS